MSDNLLPCPCGSVNLCVTALVSNARTTEAALLEHVRCNDCGMNGPLDAWNRRTGIAGSVPEGMVLIPVPNGWTATTEKVTLVYESPDAARLASDRLIAAVSGDEEAVASAVGGIDSTP